MIIDDIYSYYVGEIENNTEEVVLQPSRFNKKYSRRLHDDILLNVSEEGNNFEVVLFCGNKDKKIRVVYHVNHDFEIVATETKKWRWEN